MSQNTIIYYYDMLPFEVQKHIVSFIVDEIDNNVTHLFHFRKSLLLSTRLLNKLHYNYNYKDTICILFSSAMQKKLMNYMKFIINANSIITLSCFHFNFGNLLIERKIFYIKDRKYISYHNYLLDLCHKYNKKAYHIICFNRK